MSLQPNSETLQRNSNSTAIEFQQFQILPATSRRSFAYNRSVKTWDAVIIGGGVIGLSLAWRLRHSGVSVLVVEKGEPGREATHAAGGMIAHCDPGNPPELAAMIAASARMYPEFVRELRDEAFESPDL